MKADTGHTDQCEKEGGYMSKNRKRIPLVFLIMIIGLITFMPVPVKAETQTAEVCRLYNVSTGEQFYTVNQKEKDSLVKLGWIFEGVGWTAPAVSSVPVYRVYNPRSGDHHYTVKEAEKDALTKLGWLDEGIAFYSDETETIPVFRQYNPNQKKAGAHNYTINEEEKNVLVKAGWSDENIGWYALGEGYANPEAPAQIEAARAKIAAAASARANTAAASSGVSGRAIVEAARKWVGVGRYRSGGTNPATGTDCSGFTQYIYRQFGISLNRSSRSQTANGTKTNDPKPGDLVLWTGHAAIYAGNGIMIDAVNSSQGIRERAFARSKGAGTFLGYYHVAGVGD